MGLDQLELSNNDGENDTIGAVGVGRVGAGEAGDGVGDISTDTLSGNGYESHIALLVSAVIPSLIALPIKTFTSDTSGWFAAPITSS